MSANRPQLSRICVARGKNQWCLIGGIAAGLRKTLAPESYDLAVSNAPLLTWSADAINQHERGTVDRRAAQNVNTTAEAFRNHTLFDEPSLVRAPVTLNNDKRCAIRGLPVTHINALTGPSDQLGADDGNGVWAGYIGRRAGSQCASGTTEHPREAVHDDPLPRFFRRASFCFESILP